jgi:hypothetical protein
MVSVEDITKNPVGKRRWVATEITVTASYDSRGNHKNLSGRLTAWTELQ